MVTTCGNLKTLSDEGGGLGDTFFYGYLPNLIGSRTFIINKNNSEHWLPLKSTITKIRLYRDSLLFRSLLRYREVGLHSICIQEDRLTLSQVRA